jgi:hypothetical protein
MSYENESRRGEDAARVLNEPVLKDALTAIKTEIYEKWSATAPDNKEGREHYWRLHEAARMFEAVLTGYAEAGQAALKQMQHKQRFTLFK